MKAFFPFGENYKRTVNEDMNDYGVHLTTLKEQGELNHQVLLEELSINQNGSTSN